MARSFRADGSIMDLDGHRAWITYSNNIPIPDAPYGTVTIQIGRGAIQELGAGKRFRLARNQVVYLNVNMFQTEEFYEKTFIHPWNENNFILGHLWQCDSQKETESTAKPIYMRVKAPNEVNVRTGPSAEYGVVKKIVNGDVVPVHRIENGWSYIGDGWVNSKFLYGSEDD